MSKRRRAASRANQVRAETPAANPVALWLAGGDIRCAGYTRLCDNPEIMTGCLRIAELIGSMTIYLMSNTDQGDVRIVNELSRAIDITPNGNMTRSQWMTAIVMNLLLYGNGNSIVVPHTYEGILRSMEPISASRVSFQPVGNSYREYRIRIDGTERDPESVMHFVYNPDPTYLWKGRGVTVALKDIANNLKQAQATENAFMSSEWKPSIIVKVDALTEEFSSPEGRARLLESYVKPSRTGEPWLIPAEQFQVEQVRPLSLADLALKDTVELDKRTVASIFGAPPHIIGIGNYDAKAHNGFVRTDIIHMATVWEQETTQKLLENPKRYYKISRRRLYDYDLKTLIDIDNSMADRGYLNGDEVREDAERDPIGLTERRVLENYIPIDMSGNQKKLIQQEE